MRPLLIGVQESSPGRLAYIFSLAPGHRVTIIGPDTGDSEAAAEAIAEAVIPVIARTIAPEGITA